MRGSLAGPRGRLRGGGLRQLPEGRAGVAGGRSPLRRRRPCRAGGGGGGSAEEDAEAEPAAAVPEPEALPAAPARRTHLLTDLPGCRDFADEFLRGARLLLRLAVRRFFRRGTGGGDRPGLGLRGARRRHTARCGAARRGRRPLQPRAALCSRPPRRCGAPWRQPRLAPDGAGRWGTAEARRGGPGPAHSPPPPPSVANRQKPSHSSIVHTGPCRAKATPWLVRAREKGFSSDLSDEVSPKAGISAPILVVGSSTLTVPPDLIKFWG